MEAQTEEGIIQDEHPTGSKKLNKTECKKNKMYKQKKTIALSVSEAENRPSAKNIDDNEDEDDNIIFIKAEVELEEANEDENLEQLDTSKQSILKARLQGLLPETEITIVNDEFPTFNHFMTSLDETESCPCICHTEQQSPENKLYRCSTCDEQVCCKCIWQAHNEAHKIDARYVCNICGKAYHYKSDLRRHLTVHEMVKPHKCEVCNKRFNQVGHLITHRLTHTGEKPFLCDICNKAFNRKSNLLKHKLVHSGDRPFVCEECNSTFTRKGDLGRHRLLHTGEKPFPCNLCDKAFTQKPHLVNHQIIHSGIKPFICDWCDKSFNRKSSLVKHQQKCHQNIPPVRKTRKDLLFFRCEHCNATFLDQSTLEEHREEHGNTDLFSCPTCDKSFSHKLLLISHQGTHHNVKPFTCNLCNKTFNSSIFFRKHQASHVNRLINKKDRSIIFETVNMPESYVMVKEEPLDSVDATTDLLTEESCSSFNRPNSESSVDCDDNISFKGVADLLKGVHQPIADRTRKKKRNSLIRQEMNRCQSDENFPSDNSSEDSQFRLLNALQLQVRYVKPSKGCLKNEGSEESSIVGDTTLSLQNPLSHMETESNELNVRDTPEEKQKGQILRNILTAAEPGDKICKNKPIDSKHCNSEKSTWNMLPVKKSELKS